VIQQAKQMASQIRESSDLWEYYPIQRRKEIDRKYQSRSSHDDADRQDRPRIKKCYDSPNIYFGERNAKTNDSPPDRTAGARERFSSPGYLG
jgi:hypothetical protein